MASCVYIINMIKCFPRMKLPNCHATPGYYQRGFKMLIRQSEENSPHPCRTIQVVLKTAPQHCIRQSKNLPRSLQRYWQTRGDLLKRMDDILPDLFFTRVG